MFRIRNFLNESALDPEYGNYFICTSGLQSESDLFDIKPSIFWILILKTTNSSFGYVLLKKSFRCLKSCIPVCTRIFFVSIWARKNLVSRIRISDCREVGIRMGPLETRTFTVGYGTRRYPARYRTRMWKISSRNIFGKLYSGFGQPILDQVPHKASGPTKSALVSLVLDKCCIWTVGISGSAFQVHIQMWIPEIIWLLIRILNKNTDIGGSRWLDPALCTFSSGLAGCRLLIRIKASGRARNTEGRHNFPVVFVLLDPDLGISVLNSSFYNCAAT